MDGRKGKGREGKGREGGLGSSVRQPFDKGVIACNMELGLRQGKWRTQFYFRMVEVMYP